MKWYTWWVSVLVLVMLCVGVYADTVIDLNKIIAIESSGNANAFNKSSQARGLCQITPICLREWNDFNSTQYSKEDLFIPAVNKEIATWYLNVRIPQMLRHYRKEDSVRNRLIAYNAGISYVVNGKSLPSETVRYIEKYNK